MNKSALVFMVLGVLVLAGLFLLFRPGGPVAVQPAPLAGIAASTAPTDSPPASGTFELVIRNGQLVSGPAVIRVHAGDKVTIRLTSDRADELHLHGYDLHADLKAGVPVVLSFKATHSGRFDYELHKAHLELGALEVLPQ